MQVREIMTREPACCSPDTKVQEIARMMVEHDCGGIPVIESSGSKRPMGLVTDRDIATRVVAEGRDPARTTARECMSSPVFTVTPETDVARCCDILEKNQIRRVPVVDERGQVCGMIAQADIATFASERDTAEVVRSISQPSGSSPRTRTTERSSSGRL
ncbi:MAG TPA: CBS domain-containing protein [Candidatus Binatia bacterium]|nr:CBS domain-containing protein [Candidatus Binatia bacterium]